MANSIAQMRMRIRDVDPQLKERLRVILSYGAQQLEAYAKANARWHDNTGFARGSLHASRYDAPNQYDPDLPVGTMGIYLAHGAPYGIWLEVRWHGRYAIIMLSIQTMGPNIMRLIEQGLLQ